MLARFIGLVLLVLPLAACETVAPWVPEFEVPLGLQTWDQTLADAQNSGKLVTSGAQYEMVQRIGERLAAAAERRHPTEVGSAQWEFVLIDEPVANAWALPGGKSAIYTGLLSVTGGPNDPGGEERLAAVMGHEVSHVLLRHGAARIINNVAVQAGLVAGDLALGDLGDEDRQLVLGALGTGGSVGILLPFSREHESEADERGIKLAADAGYDPRYAVELWERMAAMGGEKPPEILSTHPSEQTRIEDLESDMPKALKIWERAKAAGR